jgi:AraC-like DNA-binding protein
VRTPLRIVDGYNQILFIQCVRGQWQGEADGRPFTAAQGDTICLDTVRPFEMVNTLSQHHFLVVPRDKLPAVLLRNPALHGTVLRSAGNLVLAAHVEALIRCLPILGEAEAARLTRGTLAILTAALGEIDDRRLSKAETAPMQPALRLRVERHIERNLSSPALTPEAISRDLGIARSSLYRAFSPLGGISSFIQLRRLDTACTLLFHPEEHRSVGELAEALGFDSAATFSKAFRRRFGCSPREARVRGSTRGGDTRAMFDHWFATTRPPADA